MKPANSSEVWHTIESLFHQAIQLPVEERLHYIRQAAGGDAQLANEVLSLVQAAEQAVDFLESDDALATHADILLERLALRSSADGSRAGPAGQPPVNATQVGSSATQSPQQALPSRVDLTIVRDFFHAERPDLEIVEQVGEGAAGIVLKANDRRLGRFVAIKVLHRGWSGAQRNDVLTREAQGALLTSDHVVRVYELAPSDAQLPYIIMEWINGPSLRGYLSQRGALRAQEAAQLMLQVSNGLQHAHAQGLVHGDIKPANASSEQLHNRLEYANTLRWLYQSERALTLIEQSVAVCEELLGKNHSTTVYGYEVWAGCLQDLGKYDSAAQLLHDAIERSPDVKSAVTARSLLASVLLDSGQYTEAERVTREVTQLREQLGLDDNRESLVLQSNLGLALVELGRTSEALELQLACAERANTLLGETHDLSVTCWLNYADTLRRTGNAAEAENIDIRIMEACRRTLGAVHPKTLDATEAVILMQLRNKDFAGALALAEQILTDAAQLPEADERRLKLTGLRASALNGLGRSLEVVPVYGLVVQRLTDKFGPQHRDVIVQSNNYGLILLDAGEVESALQLFQEIIGRAQSLDMPAIVRGLNRNYGLALIRAKRFTEARSLLEAVRAESLLHGEIDNAGKCDEYLLQLSAE